LLPHFTFDAFPRRAYPVLLKQACFNPDYETLSLWLGKICRQKRRQNEPTPPDALVAKFVLPHFPAGMMWRIVIRFVFLVCRQKYALRGKKL